MNNDNTETASDRDTYDDEIDSKDIVDRTSWALADWALDYRERDFQPFPVDAVTNQPLVICDSDAEPDDETFRGWWRDHPDSNIAIRTGSPTKTVVVRVLDPIAARVAINLLPTTYMTCGNYSSGPDQYFYCPSLLPTSARFTAPDGTPLMEILSTGSFAIVPPSIDHKGEPIFWDDVDEEPEGVTRGRLEQCVKLVAACTTLAQSWPEGALRQDCVVAVAETLLWGGEQVSFVQSFVGIAAFAVEDDEWGDRSQVEAIAASVASSLTEQPPTNANEKLATIIGADQTNYIVELLGLIPASDGCDEDLKTRQQRLQRAKDEVFNREFIELGLHLRPFIFRPSGSSGWIVHNDILGILPKRM